MPYGLLYFYNSGTNDAKTTYADVNETIANAQPLVLNGDGSIPNCFYSGSAKVVLITNAGTQAAPIDGTQQWSRDPVTSGAVGAIGTAWDSVSIYDVNSVVIYSGSFYVSIINSNQNNIPSATSTSWTLFYLLKLWNINETYGLGDPVLASNGSLYTSTIAGNLGDDPVLNSGDWTVPSIALSNGVNVLINGGFDVWQRGTSFTGTGYSADRWHIPNISGATFAQSSAVNGYADSGLYVGRLLSTNATNSTTIAQTLESPDVSLLQSNSITFSFNTASSTTQDVTVFLQKSVTPDDSGATWISLASETFSSQAGTGENFTLTTSVPDDGTALGFRVAFAVTNLPNTDTISFWGAKLEVGVSGTTFTRAGNTVAGETDMCQRYYWQGSMDGSGNGYLYGAAGDTLMLAGSHTFSSTMRGTPTLAVITPATLTNCSAPALQAANGLSGFIERVTVTANGKYRASTGVYEANSEL